MFGKYFHQRTAFIKLGKNYQELDKKYQVVDNL